MEFSLFHWSSAGFSLFLTVVEFFIFFSDLLLNILTKSLYKELARHVGQSNLALG